MEIRDQKVISKMIHHIKSILDYCSSCSSMEEFQADSMRVEATVFNMMQIGELAKTTLSDEAKSQINHIPWNQIYGMRNRIVHGYDGINMTIVWDTITTDLPVLLNELSDYCDE